MLSSTNFYSILLIFLYLLYIILYYIIFYYTILYLVFNCQQYHPNNLLYIQQHNITLKQLRQQMDHNFDYQLINNHNNNNNNQDDTYYHQYIRLYLANVALTAQVKQLVKDKNRLMERLHRYQHEESQMEDKNGNKDNGDNDENNKRRRFRRTAEMIERYYRCVIEQCGKSYGSEGSLIQHYKLKHPEIYQGLPNTTPANTATIAIQNNSSNNIQLKNNNIIIAKCKQSEEQLQQQDNSDNGGNNDNHDKYQQLLRCSKDNNNTLPVSKYIGKPNISGNKDNLNKDKKVSNDKQN